MLPRLPLLCACLLALTATPALADPIKGFYFRLERGTPTVEGIYSVGGYSVSELSGMMKKYCKGGKIGEFAHVGKAKKKRGQILQKFSTTCAGGPLDRFKGKSTGIEIGYITSGKYAGKHLVEITTSDGKGNILNLKETIKP